MSHKPQRHLHDGFSVLARRIRLATILLFSIALTGCSTFSQQRKTAQGHWNEVRARTKYQIASQQFERGQNDKAIEMVREAIATDSTSSHPFLLLARCFMEQGKLVSAKDAAEQAELLSPASARIVYTLGVIAERANQLETALTHFRRAGSLDRTEADYLVAEAECLAVMGQTEEAADLVAANIDRLDSDGTLEALLAQISLLRGDADTALARTGDAFRRANLDSSYEAASPRARVLLEDYGRLLSGAGRHSEAIAVMEAYVRNVTDAPVSVRNALSASFLATGRITEAVQLLSAEVQGNPRNSVAWLLLARASIVTEDWSTARQCAERLSVLSPQDGLAHLLLGLASWKLDDLRLAEASLRRSLDIEKSAMAHDVLARVLRDAGHSNEVVEGHFRQSRELDPQLGWATQPGDPVATIQTTTEDASSQHTSAGSLIDKTRLP